MLQRATASCIAFCFGGVEWGAGGCRRGKGGGRRAWGPAGWRMPGGAGAAVRGCVCEKKQRWEGRDRWCRGGGALENLETFLKSCEAWGMRRGGRQPRGGAESCPFHALRAFQTPPARSRARGDREGGGERQEGVHQ